MRHFVYFFPCIALLVAVAVATAVTTLMYLSIPLSSLIVSSPPFCSLVLPCLRFALFYIISPRVVERLITFCLGLSSSTDPHHSHTAIFPYHLGVLVHILIFYYIPHHSLIPRFVYCTLLIDPSHVDKTPYKGTLLTKLHRM